MIGYTLAENSPPNYLLRIATTRARLGINRQPISRQQTSPHSSNPLTRTITHCRHPYSHKLTILSPSTNHQSSIMSFNPRDRSPTLVRLLKSRLAPVREKELLAAAMNEERPEKPPPGSCCGSSCDPCVIDQYAEEVKVWKECWVKWEGDEEVVDEPKAQEAETERKMPGAYEW